MFFRLFFKVSSLILFILVLIILISSSIETLGVAYMFNLICLYKNNSYDVKLEGCCGRSIDLPLPIHLSGSLVLKLASTHLEQYCGAQSRSNIQLFPIPKSVQMRSV